MQEPVAVAAAREMPVMEQVNGQEGSGLCLEKLVGSPATSHHGTLPLLHYTEHAT